MNVHIFWRSHLWHLQKSCHHYQYFDLSRMLRQSRLSHLCEHVRMLSSCSSSSKFSHSKFCQSATNHRYSNRWFKHFPLVEFHHNYQSLSTFTRQSAVWFIHHVHEELLYTDMRHRHTLQQGDGHLMLSAQDKEAGGGNHGDLSPHSEEAGTEDENADEMVVNTTAQSPSSDQYLDPVQGQRVLIIHPDLRRRRFPLGAEVQGESRTGVSVDHELSESCALIEALPGWSVVHKEIIPVKQIHSMTVFTKGIYHDVLGMVRCVTDKTAIFIDVGMLTGLQLKTLQRDWKVPVYDRYTIILQIFRLRAKTKEAKLQLALAEIPYYRSRLRGMHEGDLHQQRGGLSYVGGSGETWMDNRARILCEKERTIRDKLSELQKRRHHQRQERLKRELPLVAVVGYTNAGKTSLIKALTKSASLEPWDQLFATLDVTCHAGYLGNHMKVIFLDTVGFISNIPTNLVESFKATLEDITVADVILHVRDMSHPDTVSQKSTVLNTLLSLDLKPGLLDSMIEVNNKSDLVTERLAECCMYTSTTTGEGLPQLVHSLEGAVIKQTSRLLKRLKIPTAGPHLSWLYKEATVTETRSCDSDSECLLVDVIMTKSSYSRFRAKYGKKSKMIQTSRYMT